MTEHEWDYLVRRHKQNDFATYGRLYDRAWNIIAVTLERPWVDKDHDQKRDRFVSRFVPGVYEMFEVPAGTKKRQYDLWEFLHVPDVDNAQIHIANFPWQLNGCIAVGVAFGDVEWTKDTVTIDNYTAEKGKSYPGITSSKTAHDRWMADTRALLAREGRSKIWVKVEDQFAA